VLVTTTRAVPLNYPELVQAIGSGVYPAERHWIDFKKELYPTPPLGGVPFKSKPTNEIYDELARDLASLAVRGGFLIFGVDEDKKAHQFTVLDMPLPAQLDQTVDQVARSRITPALYVTPTLLPNPANPAGGGLMVVEVPESPDAPHMAVGKYYGRSETGKTVLSDPEVEQLIVRRRRADARLSEAMTATAQGVAGMRDERISLLRLTAVPTQGWSDMLLRFTRDQPARTEFLRTATPWVHEVAKEPGRPNDTVPAFSELQYHHRAQSLRGAWFLTFPADNRAALPRRCVGLGDDGTIRFIDLIVGSLPNGMHPVTAQWQRTDAPAQQPHRIPVVYEEVIWWDVVDSLYLIGEIAAFCGYTGAWLLGVEVDGVHARSSAALAVSPVASATVSDSDTLSATSRATSTEIRGDRLAVADQLIRPVLRDLGCEFLLRRWNPKASLSDLMG